MKTNKQLVILLVLGFILLPRALRAGDTEIDSLVLSPNYITAPVSKNTGNTEYTISLKIYFDTDHLPKTGDTIKVKMDNISFPVKPELEKNQFVVSKEDSTNGVLEASLKISLRNQTTDIKSDNICLIKISGFEKSSTPLLMKPAFVYDEKKYFWVELGANLDLIDGLKANNLFGGVFYYKRDIQKIGKRHTNNLAFLGAVYESKALAFRSNEDYVSNNFIDGTSLSNISPDSIQIYKAFGKVKIVRNVTNIGILASPQIRLSKKLSSENGAHFYLGLWLEALWQNFSIEYDYTEQATIDTLIAPLNDLNLYRPTFRKENTNVDFATHYFGAGLPVYIQEKDANLTIHSMLGACNQIAASTQEVATNSNLSSVSRNWYAFYLVQFRLNEDQYGLSFSGEVRGLLKKNSPPVITLVLSKKFDLAKLIEFTTH